LGRKLAIALTIAASVSGVLTYVAVSGTAPDILPDPRTILILLNIDLVLLLLLGAVVARRIVELWTERRRGLAGSRLHVRLVVLFSLVAVTPTITVAVFSVLFFNFGLQGWFSDRVRTAINQSLVVAEAYLREHQQVITNDIVAMADDISREGALLMANPPRLKAVVEAQSLLRSLTETLVFDRDGKVLARAGFSLGLEFEKVPDWAIEEARNGRVAILTSEDEDRVRALVRLGQFGDIYLFIGRHVEPRVINHIERVREAVSTYQRMEGERSGIEVTFAMIFATVALLFLFAAVWVGLSFATSLARPVSALVNAAERVRGGDLGVRVEDSAAGNELGSLSRAFNRMTSQLEGQRRELMDANQQLDTRRRFTEAVLAGVSAGVIGLDQHGNINLPNRMASELLSTELDAYLSMPLAEVVPEMTEIVSTARAHPDRPAESQITLTRDGRVRTLLVRVTGERGAGAVQGFVVTFTDITALLLAQRKAAWADIARRIAHEIKNPLTPIQLSAERLKRKYLKQIADDPETFEICTETIIRQVGDIGRMVDEFSAFAQMPAPVMKHQDLVELSRQAMFLQQSAHADIEYAFNAPDGPVEADCDARQIGQALTNLLKNAAEAIYARDPNSGNRTLAPGRVELRLSMTQGYPEISILDNGVGLPADFLDQLTEPYVTTRSKGTGLGLAIVKKIMEDHGGELMLDHGGEGGARVSLLFSGSDEDDTARDEGMVEQDETATGAAGGTIHGT
jgi:two-component system nitrogen regulation sensor histidine kinase NtrY